MDISLFFAKLFGITLVVEGLFILMRRDAVRDMVRSFFTQRALMYPITMLLTMLGATFVLLHNVWNGIPQVIITIIGWVIFIKGLFLLFLPAQIERFTRKIGENSLYYVITAIIMLVFGVYLLLFGFGAAL